MNKIGKIFYFLFISAELILTSFQAHGEACQPSGQMGLGTHYKPVTQQKIDISQGLNISGVVLSATDCSPIENARIEHWQTNTNGKYVDELRAYLLSGSNGEFEFETEWPGAPVPHIHFIVDAEGYKRLVYQWIGMNKVEEISLELVLEENQ